MEIFQKEIKDIDTLGPNDLVLDIETTGFKADYRTISVIGYILYEGGSLVSKELISETGYDKEILSYFLKDLKESHRIISFNGDSFDLPFIKRRMEINELELAFTPSSLDLYKYLKKNQDFSPYPAMGQKKLEKYLGIERDSDMDGKEATRTYWAYLESGYDRYKKPLIHYNYLDNYYLAKLFKIYREVEAIKTLKMGEESFKLDSLEIKEDFFNIFLTSPLVPPFPIDIREDDYSFTWEKDPMIRVKVIKGLINKVKLGYVLDKRPFPELTDQSPYRLYDDLFLLKDDSYQINNIKNLSSEILKRVKKNFKEDLW